MDGDLRGDFLEALTGRKDYSVRKPIPTEFDGHHFRSRLEARWATVFRFGGIPYNYELQGFNLGGVRYLPDFWLPTLDMWAEVKPVALNDVEMTKAARLAVVTGKPCLLLIGKPEYMDYAAVTGLGESGSPLFQFSVFSLAWSERLREAVRQANHKRF